MGKLLMGFKFNPAKRTKRTPKATAKKLSRLIYGVCQQRGDIWVAVISGLSEHGMSSIELPFSENSYDLKGKVVIFDVKPDKHGKHPCRIRDIQSAKYFPGLPTQYTPFHIDYVYSGYIVKENNQRKFDMAECIGHIRNNYNLVNNEHNT